MDSVEVDFKAKTATVTMKTGTLDKAAIEKAFKDKKYSYTVSSFEKKGAKKVPGSSPSIAEEGFICPLTGEILPCPDCCPLSK